MPDKPAPPPSRVSRLPLLIVAVAVTVGFIASGWLQSGGHLMAPLDDTYIHLQYAQRLSQGHFFSYSSGVGYSSGATSWLWAFLLTPLFWIGASGVKAMVLSIALCGGLFLLSGLFIHRLAHELTGAAVGLWIGLLFLLNGHVAWAYLSGMETGLFTMLILLALAGWRAWTEEESRGGWRVFLIALALLPLTRPEGWALWGVAVGLAVVRGLQQRASRGEALYVLAAGALGLVAAILHRAKAGEWTTTGMILKGLWDQPDLTLSDKIAYLTDHVWSIAVRFYNNVQPDPLQAEWRGQWMRPFAPPFAVVLAVLGGGMGMVAEWRRGRVGAMSLAMLWWVVGLATVAMAASPFVHNQRYLVPWTPLMLLLAGVGLARVARLFDPHDRSVVWGVGLVWVGLATAGAGWWAVEYGRNASDIFHQHRRMSWIVAEETAPGERLAVTDAGVIAYYADRPVFDLVGLCSSAAEARTFREGDGSVFEALERMPAAERPVWIVTYPGWWGREFPLGKPWAVAGLASTSITSGPDLTLYRFDPAPLGSGRFPSRYLGDRGLYLPDVNVPDDPEDLLDARLQSEFWEVADEVDVADRESEKAHGYRREEPPGQRPADADRWPPPWNRTEARLADLPRPAAGTNYVEFRRDTWSLTRDVPAQEHLFAYYTDHGSDWATAGSPETAPLLAAGAEALKALDRITTPTFTDLLEILPPSMPALARIHEGGRSVAMAEEFTLTPRGAGGKSGAALLYWRTDTETTLTLRVQVDGKSLDPWTIPPATAGHWREAWLPIPAEHVTGKALKFRVEFDPPGLPVAGAALSAHWWLLQTATP